MLQGKYVFFARFYRALSCEKLFKDEYKKFLLTIIFILAREGGGYFLVVGSNGYVPLDGVAFSGLTIMGLHF